MFFNSVNDSTAATTSVPKSVTKQVKHNRRLVTKNETFVNKIKNSCTIFAVKLKKLFSRLITKIEDFVLDLSLSFNKKAEELESYIKNIKTPFRKNYFSCKIGGANFEVSRKKKIGDYFK